MSALYIIQVKRNFFSKASCCGQRGVWLIVMGWLPKNWVLGIKKFVREETKSKIYFVNFLLQLIKVNLKSPHKSENLNVGNEIRTSYASKYTRKSDFVYQICQSKNLTWTSWVWLPEFYNSSFPTFGYRS